MQDPFRTRGGEARIVRTTKTICSLDILCVSRMISSVFPPFAPLLIPIGEKGDKGDQAYLPLAYLKPKGTCDRAVSM